MVQTIEFCEKLPLEKFVHKQCLVAQIDYILWFPDNAGQTWYTPAYSCKLGLNPPYAVRPAVTLSDD